MQRVQQPRLFLDSASTTPIHPEILDGYCRLLGENFYNTDALYDGAIQLAKMMKKSREAVATMLQVQAEEVIFTSGASEANNFAIKGLVFNNPDKKHIITTQIEHSSVLNVFKGLEENFGYEVTYLSVNEEGIISIDELKQSVRQDTLLISIMMVNNEIGSIQPIDKIKTWIKKNTNAFFHVDAVQAVGKINLHLEDIDLISISAHKIEGLKGSGVLIKKKHVHLLPLIDGGQQEKGLRGGTSNAIVNIFFAKTLRLALENKERHERRMYELKEELIKKLKMIDGILINTPSNSVATIVNFSYLKIPSEVMMNALNQRGIDVAAHSTCSSRLDTGSKVLQAMGFKERSTCCIRVSFSYHTQKNDIERFIESLKEVCQSYGNL